MYRWLLMGSLAALLVGSTGCLHHNVRGGCSTGSCGTNSCGGGNCGTGEPVGVLSRMKAGHACNSANCGGGCQTGTCNGKRGMLGRIGSMAGVAGCGNCAGCRASGCQTGPLGWQQGGLDYSSHLNPGVLGHQAGNQLNSQPFQAGPPTGQVAYPYYSVRGPRDFFMDNPPTIGR